MTSTPLIADRTYLRYFWHPVCTLQEFEQGSSSGTQPFAVTLLNENLVLAKLNGKIVAFYDRCAHRYAKLSGGRIKKTDTGDRLECPYHGWQYDTQGICRSIPACPDLPIPKKARTQAFDCATRYDIVWVRLDSSYSTEIPTFSDWDTDGMRIAVADSYVWKTSAERRWENFTDFSHFAFVHPGTLYDPAFARPPIAPVHRINGELRFSIEPPIAMLDQLPENSPLGSFNYRCSMPYTINLEIALYRRPERFILWTTSSPIDDSHCRNFMIIARVDDGSSDQVHIDFQKRVLMEDQPVIESQLPHEITTDELSMATDKVSIQYRKWLRELSQAAIAGKQEFEAVLYTDILETTKTAAPPACI